MEIGTPNGEENRLQVKRIDLIKLDKHLREGKSGEECAKIFGVSPAAISKARKKLQTNIVRTVGMEKAAQVVEAHLDMAGQLRRINQTINSELDRTQIMIEEADELGDKAKIQDVIVKLAGEIRKQLNAQIEIFEAYRDFRNYQQFQETVLNILERFEPGARNEAIVQIKRNGLLRGTAEIN